MNLSSRLIEDFVQHPVWKALAEDILTRGLIMAEENDTINPLEPREAAILLRNQGGIATCKLVVDWPAEAKREAEEREQDEAKDRKKEEEKK